MLLAGAIWLAPRGTVEAPRMPPQESISSEEPLGPGQGRTWKGLFQSEMEDGHPSLPPPGPFC